MERDDYMADTQKPFVRTTDEETAQTLKSLGFYLLKHDGNEYIFLNPGTETPMPGNFNQSKLAFTNIISM